MTLPELEKLAHKVPEVGRAIIKIARDLQKKALDAAGFNETVPAVVNSQNNTDPNSLLAQAQPPAGAQSVVPEDPNAQMAAVPMEEQSQGMNPADEAAYAAQQFMAPLFDAAMQGDPNAIQAIAIAAGNVARGVAEAANSAMMGGGEMVPPEGEEIPVDEAGNPMVPVSPEEAAADNVVPAPSEKMPPPGETGTGEGNEAPTSEAEKKQEKKPFPPKKEEEKKASLKIELTAKGKKYLETK